jgi:hypothetical protein
MFNDDSTGPLPTPYRLGSRVGHIAPLYEAPHEPPRFFSHTAPIIHPSRIEQKIQEEKKQQQEKVVEQSWLAEKFEKFLGLNHKQSEEKPVSSLEESLNKNDYSNMSYQQCIQMRFPNEKCKQFEKQPQEMK